jgi:hypothetical protein
MQSFSKTFVVMPKSSEWISIIRGDMDMRTHDYSPALDMPLSNMLAWFGDARRGESKRRA